MCSVVSLTQDTCTDPGKIGQFHVKSRQCRKKDKYESSKDDTELQKSILSAFTCKQKCKKTKTLRIKVCFWCSDSNQLYNVSSEIIKNKTCCNTSCGGGALGGRQFIYLKRNREASADLSLLRNKTRVSILYPSRGPSICLITTPPTFFDSMEKILRM